MGRENRYKTAESLEEFLGSPLNPENALSFKRSVERDELEQYPEEADALLNEWGLHYYYVPIKLGGKLSSYEELLSLIRVVARRDFTLAMSHATTSIASAVVWVAGSQEQQRRAAELIKSKERVAITFHEQEHGNDLLSCEVEAIETAEGYLLSGEKWVVGNPKRCGTLVIFARTRVDGGPRGFSLLLAEKRNLEGATYTYLPKFKTHGVRGHEIAGIRFRDCSVRGAPVLGPVGSGLEAALKSSQVTRITTLALALGAVDTALRITLDFALSRRLYGETVFTIPHAQSLLTDAFLDLLICECVALAAARGLHEATGQMSVRAAVAKYFIPTTLAHTLRDLAVVLGARHYLREGHFWGVFQKILRDFPFTSISHYSSVINLSHLAPQLQSLAQNREKGGELEQEEVRRRLQRVFCLDKELGEFNPARLSLHNGGKDDVMQGWAAALRELRMLQREGEADQGVLKSIQELSGRLIGHLSVQEELLRQGRAEHPAALSQSAEAFEMASRYSRVHAGAACVQMWLHNRERLGEFFGRGKWLVLSLDRLVRSFEPERGLERRRHEAEVAQELVRLYEVNAFFSIVPWQLANN